MSSGVAAWYVTSKMRERDEKIWKEYQTFKISWLYKRYKVLKSTQEFLNTHQFLTNKEIEQKNQIETWYNKQKNLTDKQLQKIIMSRFLKGEE